jgi:hypothetical protein
VTISLNPQILFGLALYFLSLVFLVLGLVV